MAVTQRNMPRKLLIPPPLLLNLSAPQVIFLLGTFIICGTVISMVKDTTAILASWFFSAILIGSEYIFLRLTNALRRSFFKHTIWYMTHVAKTPKRYSGRYKPI